MRYTEWMEKVNDMVWDRMGVSVHDLPDLMFSDRYDEGFTPEEFVDLEVMREQEDVGYYDFFE